MSNTLYCSLSCGLSLALNSGPAPRLAPWSCPPGLATSRPLTSGITITYLDPGPLTCQHIIAQPGNIIKFYIIHLMTIIAAFLTA